MGVSPIFKSIPCHHITPSKMFSSSSSSDCGECAPQYQVQTIQVPAADCGAAAPAAPAPMPCAPAPAPMPSAPAPAPVSCAPAPAPTCTKLVTMYKMEPYQAQVPVKKTIMVSKEVPTIECKQVPRQVPSTKQVMQMVDEPYIKTITVQEPGTKKVQKAFTVDATREVIEMVKVPTKITVPVQKWVDDMKTVTKYKTVPYTVQVPTKKLITVQEQRPSFKMEKVAKTVPYNKIVTRWVDVPATKTVTKQIISSRKVNKISIVSSTKTVMETVKIVGAKTIKVPEVIDAMRTVTKYRQVPYQKTVEGACPVKQPCVAKKDGCLRSTCSEVPRLLKMHF